jgi:pyruvate dehydrogenase E2 component (dihydrolipoamide acetyltransferase)
MATEITIPQLGESVTEGTVTAWLVEVGDKVEADQPLFELSSEKIDTEVPSPVSGVLKEIKVGVDETVDVGTVVAVIDEGGEAEAKPEAEAEAEPEAEEEAEPEAGEEPAPEEEPEAEPEAEGEAEQRPAAEEGDGQRRLASPLVRRLVAEHDLDLSRIEPSGKGGRVTREDVEAAIAAKEKQPAAKTAERKAPEKAAARPTVSRTGRVRTEDLSRIRQRIAAKMMESLQSSAQLTTVQEADVTGIMQLRTRIKDDFREREGVSLSPFVFLARAAVLALRNHPAVNAQADWQAGKATYYEYVNLGIAVDTEKGLIVPNVKDADGLTLAGLARGIQEAADKARGKGKLEMQDIEGGTFTVTNTGSRGVLIDTPILNYPEVAILGTGAIQKRPVAVENDSGPAIAVRDMIYLSLTYDHRLIDGADAARYVTDVAEVLETYDWVGEIGYGE